MSGGAPPASLVGLLRAAAASYGARPALARRGLLRYERWSYAELLTRAEQAAAALVARGVRPGDRVVTLAPNGPALVAAYFGIWAAGAILVPLDLRTPPAVVARMVARAGPRLLLADVDSSALPADYPAEPLAALWSTANGTTCAAGSAWGSGPEPAVDLAAALPRGVSPDAVAEIVFTSGTTSEPKGVVLTHANVLASVHAGRELLPLRPGDAVLSLLPLSHMLEQVGGLLVPLTQGAQIVYPAGRQPRAVLRALRDNHVAAMVVVPQLLELLRRAVDREAGQQHPQLWAGAHRLAPSLPWWLRRALFAPAHAALGGQLTDVLCGGASLPPALQMFWERLGVRVIQGYGSTECAPGVTSNRQNRRTPGSAGRPLRGVNVRLAPDGELLVRGPNVSPGYWNDPAATAAAFADGWYHSGDLGVWSNRGDLGLRGRKHDLIVLADGRNVYPDDVETVLRSDPVVRDCVVLEARGRDDAPQVHAVILPAAEADESMVRTAVRRAAAQLAPHQVPTLVSMWPEGDFPRTPSLKPRRAEIAAALQAVPGRLTSTVDVRDAATLPVARATHPASPSAAAVGGDSGPLVPLLARLSGRSAATIAATDDLSLDLGLDSLARVELVALLAEEYGVELDDDAVAAAGTVGDLAALVAAGARPAAEPAFPRWARATPVRLIRAFLQQAVLFPLLSRVCRPLRVEGREHLRGLRPPLLLVANHSSHLDTVVLLRALPAAVRGRIAVAAAADYFYTRAPLALFVTLALGAFPLARTGRVRPSLEYCGELVDAGWALLVYPEGTRSPDGRLQPFRAGIGLLAAELRVPVVPAYLSGLQARLPRGAGWPRPGPVGVRFGPPLRVRPGTPYAAVTAQLEAAMRGLHAAWLGCGLPGGDV
jgi:long-chain acyl-CoA synthetase